ncbi:juvenile hormone acid O-methyltransferase-like isoform X1 [Lutzomyia longipalpis]|uniref:juvenile hormone acid O-methyltransferase-like isoform X1 n=2 Tax=Lutzomyia longipalpis TaxID=7200 RepID=UPI0024842A17|nr:juvenile hormone acid O-methyltransferase-like isoform X1 [Lutzomyia longipalpis]
MKNFNLYTPKLYATSLELRCKSIQALLTQHADKLQWRGGERIMDIGCGLGDIVRRVILPMLPPDYTKLVCVDASTVMLNEAQNELKSFRNIEFLEMDFEADLNESLTGSFDRIFSTLCFMYLADQRKAFENVFNLLAPGGDCFIMFLSTGIIFETFFQLAETPKWKEQLKHLREIYVFPYREDPDPERTLTNLLTSIGFKDVFVKKEDFFHLYPNVEKLTENIKTMLDFPNSMTNKEREELLEDQIKTAISFNVVEGCRDESKPLLRPRHETLTVYAKRP